MDADRLHLKTLEAPLGREAIERLLAAEDARQLRLASLLHTSAAQNLAAIRMLVSQLPRSRSGGSGAAEALGRLTSELADDLRRAVAELNPPRGAAARGLAPAIEAYAAECGAAAGVAITCHCPAFAGRQSALREAAAFRIIREALGNIVRHARARTASVVAEERGGALSLIIEDDGCGIAAEAAAAADPAHGIGAMRCYAALLGGSIAFETGPRGGTGVFVRLPLA